MGSKRAWWQHRAGCPEPTLHSHTHHATRLCVHHTRALAVRLHRLLSRFLAAYAYRSTMECGKYNTSSQCYAATAQQCSWYGNACGLEVTSFFDPNVSAMRGWAQLVVWAWHSGASTWYGSAKSTLLA